ncbi:MAG TPA: DciA family protein, partial [Beijerinckiaceae bacterium]
MRSPRKPIRARPLADLVGEALDPIVAKQGFGESDVILNWDDIVGPRLAAVSEPQKLQWPPRPPGRLPDAPPEPASLIVRVEGAFALEMQHVAPILIERVNARLGWRCVGRLV